MAPLPTQLEDDRHVRGARGRLGMVLRDKWTLDSLLGVGGMAAVYSATHRNGKRVAVKMLHAELSHDEEVRRRFLQEGYAANTVQHDGAVSVLDDDVAVDGSAFLVMELLEGETIEARWESLGRRLPLREVLAITEQLLGVLEAAHAKSVVHRDIKPDNLFLTSNGTLKVLDFGIAKVFETDARATSTRAGMVLGTPAFMAPEQALGRWNEVDARTDLWAVGATMFTLLTGRNVHEAESAHEQLVQSATTRAPAFASVAPNEPAIVAAIVDRALAFERERRWPDAASMRSAVRAAQEATAPLGAGTDAVVTSSVRRVIADTFRSLAPISARASTGTHLLSSPSADGRSAVAASVAGWMQERGACAASVARLRLLSAEVQGRHAAAKKRSSELRVRLDGARAERASLEHWFKRQVGTRAASVEEARQLARLELSAIGRRAMADRATFGADFHAARAHVARLDSAAESAARDVVVHEAALDSHEPRAFRVGVVWLGIAAAFLVALLIVPIVWRATRVVAPPPPNAPPSSASH